MYGASGFGEAKGQGKSRAQIQGGNSQIRLVEMDTRSEKSDPTDN